MKKKFLCIFLIINFVVFGFFAFYLSIHNFRVLADNINVNLSNTDKCQKSVISSTLTTSQYTDAVNNLTDTTYRNGSYFLFNQTLTFNHQQNIESNRNYYFLYRGAFYYNKNQFSSYSNAVTLFEQNITSAYSIGKYKVFSFGGYDFYANLYIRNEGVWSSSTQWNNGEFYSGFFLFFDASTLSYVSYSDSGNLKEFSVNNDNIVISTDVNINQTLAMFGVHFYNIPYVTDYSTGSNGGSYVDNNYLDLYNVWNLNLHNKANNKFYDHINKITYTKLESDFNINIGYNVTNKYNFSTIYLALNTGLNANYPNVNDISIITNFRFNFYNDLYNFYDVPDTRSLIKYSFSNDLTAYLTDIDYIPVLNYWGGDLVKYDNTKFKFNGLIDNSLYFAYDGTLTNSFLPTYIDSDNSYSQNLYRNNVEWYDIFGHLYNFFIYLIFDMPIISNITTPLYFFISNFFNLLSYTFDNLITLGVIGAVIIFLIFYAIIRKFIN